MSLFRPVSAQIASLRTFSTTSTNRASPLFALSALSNRNETAHFAQISRLNRVNHSPALELIQESEVKPFTKTDSSQDVVVDKMTAKDEELMQSKGSMLDYAQARPSPSSSSSILQASVPSTPVDAAMLQTLQQMSTQLANLEAKLVEMGIETEKDVRRTGALVTLLAAGAVAGLGVWKFWPPEAVRGDTFAKKHVQERSRILPAEVVGHHSPMSAGAVMGEPAVFPTVQHPVVVPTTTAAPINNVEQGNSWRRSLFWKEH